MTLTTTLSTKDFAQKTGWSDRTIRRLMRRGDLRALRVPGGRDFRIPVEEADRFIKKAMAAAQGRA